MQDIVIFQPASTNEYQERVGMDQHIPVRIFRTNENELHGQQWLHKKVEATCHLNGREFTTQRGLSYRLQLNLKEIKLID